MPTKTFTREDIQNRLQNFVQDSQGKVCSGVNSIITSAAKAWRNRHNEDMSIASKAVLAKSLGEVQNRLLASGKTMQEINSAAENIGDVNNPISMLFSIMSVVIPNFAYQEVAGIQPLPTAISPIFFPQISANENRNNVSAGTVLLGSTGWEKSNTYSTNKYTKQFALAASTSTTLTMDYPSATFTLVPGSVTAEVTVSGSTFVIQDNGEGVIPANAVVGFSGGTIDYSAKTVTLTFASATAVTDSAVVTYRYNAEQDPAQVILEWTTKPVHADPYRLRSTYKVDNFMAAKQVLEGYDIDQVLNTALAGEINKEISCGVFDDLRARSDSTFTFSNTVPSGVPWTQYRYEILQTIVESANFVRSVVQRASGNRLVADQSMSNLLETFGNDVFVMDKMTTEPIGPYKQGTILGRIEVIKNQDFGTKGSTISYKLDDLDASFLGGSFISLYSSAPLTMDTLKTVQGFGTQVGFRKTFDGSISTIKIV